MSITLQRTRPEECLSDLALDGLASDVLEGEKLAAARAHLASCSACRDRLSAIERERPKSNLRVLYGGAGILLAAGVALFAAFVPRHPPIVDVDVTRTKGGASLGFYVRHDQGVRRGASGETVAPNDALRFYYSIDHPAHLTILSVDANGKLSVYSPPVAATPGREVILENAVLLDATVGKEKIYGFFCDSPMTEPEIDPVPEGCTRVVVDIEKRP